MANVHRRRARRRALRRGRNGHNGHGRRSWLLAVLGVFAIVLVAGVATLGGVAYGVYQSYADDLDPPDVVIRNTSAGGALILDRNGVPLYQFADPNQGLRQPVSLDKIATPMIIATISTEDASFYDNPGVNIRGLLRAATENFLPGGDFGFLEGGGGSSITQQLVKNLYIEEDDRYKRGAEGIPRKIEETVIALELTRKYDKDQILEWYLNQIFYGNNSYGVEAAAQRYFGKHASELTLAEAAMLAGIPASPTVYDPIGRFEDAKRRQIEVLDLMARHEFITQAEADAAKVEQLVFATAEESRLLAPHWVFHLWNTETGEGVLLDMCDAGLIERPDNIACRDLIEGGGLRVQTTLDINLQAMAEEIIRDWISQYEATSRGHNGALMAMDPRTGEVLVYVGSRDYNNPDILGKNDMIQALNSPGSSFKPIVYLTAFMRGWAPASVIWDTPVKITNPDGSVFQPRNPNGDYRGPITVRNALGASLNVPAVKTAREIGIGPVIDQARRMGYTSLADKNRFGPALATGGGDITLHDHVFAFSALANNGMQHGVPAAREDRPDWWPTLQPVTVLEIRDSEENLLYKFDAPESVRVAPAVESYLITDVLTDDEARSATFGRGSSLNLSSRDAAVKTGTSEPFETSRAIGETWAIGYTPQLVAGVWIGNADNTPMINITSATVATRSWNEFMTRAHEALGLEPAEFARPEGVVEATVILPGGGCGNTGTDLVRAGLEETYVHRYCREDDEGVLKVDLPEGEQALTPRTGTGDGDDDAEPTPSPTPRAPNPFEAPPPPPPPTPVVPNPFADPLDGGDDP